METFESLLTQSQTSNVQPEMLEMLGRKAAQMFQQQGVSLNQAISQLLAQHPELGNEHVKRIVEFANNVTFQEMFETSQDKNVHFPVADPGVVLRDLKDGGSPAFDGKTLRGGEGDYLNAPQQQTQPGLEQAFNNQFAPSGGDQMQAKLASTETIIEPGLHVNPVDDLYDTHINLQAARDQLAHAHEQFNLLSKEANETFWQAVKKEVLWPDGAGLGGVIGALEKIASKEVVAEIMLPITTRLLDIGIDRKSLGDSLEKRAGVFVNPDHPLIKAWAGIEKTAYECARSKAALDEIDEHLSKTSGALTTAVKQRMGAKSPLPGGIRQRFPRK